MPVSVVILLIAFVCILTVAFVKGAGKGNVVLISVVVTGIISSIVGVKAILGESYTESWYGGFVFRDILVKVDALSGWFILIMNFTALTAILYGKRYLVHYKERENVLTIHYISYLLNHVAMLGIYSVHNSLVFLCFWEIMAISAFLLMIFEHWKMETLRSGINYLIQSHLSIIFLTIGFIWVNYSTNSFGFDAITSYTGSIRPEISFLLFICFFIGFGFKAGFVPFHTWLPYAHPAAPAHVSGLMSGVIIKLGIYGILRMLLLIPHNYLALGMVILIISVITGIYGVMLAILQHNLKRLLAYHSIENVGIIGMGIGLGAIGLGIHNSFLAFAGFAGALLHTLNHSLFKSLLFFTAGSVYQAIHFLNVERMGGLIKRMPHTAILFLLASLAICGLPPFNGFISEFLIYSGLFQAIPANPLTFSITIISSVFGLVLIGGLAFLCFAKAFGIVFLGSERSEYPSSVTEPEFTKRLPQYMIAFLIIGIGLFPQIVLSFLSNVVRLFTGHSGYISGLNGLGGLMQHVSLSAWLIIGIALLVLFLRNRVSGMQLKGIGSTWGCGYVGSSPKLQYTASSFVRSYRKLIKPLVKVHTVEGEITSVVPEEVLVESHVTDKLEAGLIDVPLRRLKGFIGRFRFLQNGSVQFYVLYGVVFIIIAITIPLLYNALVYFIDLIKQL